jgi:hypothetical protein
LPIAKIDTFQAATWRPRSWPSVDSKVDEAMHDLAIKNRLRAPSDIGADHGHDRETMVRRLARTSR